MSLRGKTLFITGASRGIGLAIAKRAAREGANVAVVAKTTDPHPRLPGTIHSAAAEIEAAGGKALPIQLDIREEAGVEAAAKKCAEVFGGIDIVVNNASAISLTGTRATPMKRFDLMFGVNVRGTFSVTQACLPYLTESAKAGRNPHVLDPVAAAEHGREVVPAPRRVHHGQVRHEHVCAGHGRGAARRRHRGQCPVAAHRDQHGRRWR